MLYWFTNTTQKRKAFPTFQFILFYIQFFSILTFQFLFFHPVSCLFRTFFVNHSLQSSYQAFFSFFTPSFHFFFLHLILISISTACFFSFSIISKVFSYSFSFQRFILEIILCNVFFTTKKTSSCTVPNVSVENVKKTWKKIVRWIIKKLKMFALFP